MGLHAFHSGNVISDKKVQQCEPHSAQGTLWRRRRRSLRRRRRSSVVVVVVVVMVVVNPEFLLGRHPHHQCLMRMAHHFGI